MVYNSKEMIYMPTTADMYNCIEAERARNKMTIAEFTSSLEIGEKTYRNWRDNEKPLSADILVKISQLFKCSVDYLLCLTDKVRIE
mgnify:CR=1 FL=1